MEQKTYKQIINESIQKVFEKGIATRILQYMDGIRNAFDIAQARRWVMELLQNAQDLAWEDRAVKVRITLEKERLTFEHTGRPFRIKDILAIINQVSSKDPGVGVGKFGTGFMTTYQLSGQVEIHSVLKEEGLPYRPFCITLDRSGRTQEELQEAIKRNIIELEMADETDCLSEELYDKNEYHTAFIYHLESERSRETAGIGMRDLKDTIRYILLFAHGLQTVELDFGGEGKVVYEKGETRMAKGADGEDFSAISQSGEGQGCPGSSEKILETVILENGEKHFIRHLSVGENAGKPFLAPEKEGDGEECRTGERKTETEERTPMAGLTVAMEYDYQKGYLPLPEHAARVFIDFPLIGTEDFPFPMVVNSRGFRPNEPRSSITLVDFEQSEDAKINKALMERAVGLYGTMLHSAVEDMGQGDTRGVEHMIRMPLYRARPDWSESWIQEHLYDRMFALAAAEEIFDTAEGRKSLECDGIFLIYSDSEEERREMGQLCGYVQGILTPRDEIDWYQALSSYRQIQDRHITLEQMLQNAKTWFAAGIIEGDGLTWCQKLYDLGMANPVTESMIRTGRAAIFPNQKLERGDRNLYTASELYRDPKLPEILKDVTEKLDVLVCQRSDNSHEPLRIREKLLHQDFHAEQLLQMQEYLPSELTDYIIARSSRKFLVSQFHIYQKEYLNAWREAWLLMLACGEDEKFYAICSSVIEELQENAGEDEKGTSQTMRYRYEKLGDERFNRFLWKNSYVGLIGLLIERLESVGSMNALPEGIDAGWLTEFFRVAPNYEDISVIGTKQIFPDQYGRFRMMSFLARDEVHAEELKKIACCFKEQDEACDVLSELLDSKVRLDSRWPIRVMGEGDVAVRISRVIQRILTRGNLNDESDQIQEACARLLAWLQEHPKETERYFPEYTTEEQQARLMTAKAVVRLQRRGRTLDQLTEIVGSDDPDILLEFMRNAVEEKRKKEAGEAEEDLDSLSGGYDYGTGVFFGPEFLEMAENERNDAFRQIGTAGEEYAVEYLLKKFQKEGWESVLGDGHRYVLLKEGSMAEIYRPDTEYFHQEGWDIRVRYWNQLGTEKTEEGTLGEGLNTPDKTALETVCSTEYDREKFIEVKTHTETSRKRGLLPLSDSQMRLALSEGQDYAVYMVDYNWPMRKAVGVTELPDIGKQIAEGRIRCAVENYMLKVTM